MVDLDAVPCPYCGSNGGMPCVEDCPQYPVDFEGDVVVADPPTLVDWLLHREPGVVDQLT